MSVILSIVLFFLGLFLGMQFIAALYGIIDLWYTIRTAWSRVAVKIVLWGGLALIAALVAGSYRASFLYGLAAFALCHVAGFLFNRFVMGPTGKKEDAPLI